MRSQIERRVTPWKPVWFDDPRLAAVRIWQEFDGRHWYQMHEWERADGTRYAEGWIQGVRGWSKNAIPASEPAPGDPPALDADEIAYLIDRLAGVNDPGGQAIREKLIAMTGNA